MLIRLLVLRHNSTDCITGRDLRKVVAGNRTVDTAGHLYTAAILDRSTVTTAVGMCSRSCNPF